ncbi:hypothetical protein [Streptococcus sp. 5346]|jgi:hypothetical protein|uniref:hypothetical protein n=1 Tax=Streptococcus sp. 5346 TaxID=2582636 RepID=UPI001564FD4A|nr:hypothetical protein [Streptococcus sp. 5346]
MLNYPNNVQLAVEDMCRVYNTPEKRKYAANQARLHLSHNTKSDLYSQALAELFNSLNINTRIQEEYAQKLVAFYFYSKASYYGKISMYDDFNNCNGKLPHRFTTYS